MDVPQESCGLATANERLESAAGCCGGRVTLFCWGWSWSLWQAVSLIGNRVGGGIWQRQWGAVVVNAEEVRLLVPCNRAGRSILFARGGA